jgi:hypothetical protein
MSLVANPLPGVPSVESPFRQRLFADQDAETRRVAEELDLKGYAVIDFPDPEFDQVSAAIRAGLAGGFDLAGWRRDGHAAGNGLRVQDAWQYEASVLRIATNPGILALLGRLYGRRAWPFQTLNFPVGTQQHYHSDAVHFSSMPERFMCGVWVALEDIGPDQGPLVYYPGSHKWPIYANEHIGLCAATREAPFGQQVYEGMWRALVAESGVRPELFLARKGQALIWAANLLHGGSRHANPALTRWSQVTHYYFDDCAYFTPMRTDFSHGSICFRDLVDISTGKPVPQQCAGHVIPPERVDALRPRPGVLPAGFDEELYYQANPDVRASGMPAFEHWFMYGRAEGRRLRP